jgi:DNA-nicking Smr family endonuclease
MIGYFQLMTKQVPPCPMSNTSDENFDDLMQSLGGIRKLKQDKVDVLQQRPRKRHQLHRNRPIDAHTAATAKYPFNHGARHIPEATAESWFHHGLQKKLQKNIRMGKLEIESILDLHGYRQHEALSQLQAFLDDALAMQARMVMIIHGKGYNSQSESVLRPLVQHWLSEQSAVLAWCPAQIRDGGLGASYVYLRTIQEDLD